MSFYGNIKRVDSSPWVFDRIFPNRADMEGNIQNDNIYVGRYVLIKYTCKYTDSTRQILTFFEKYNGNDLSEDYQANITADAQYKQTYNATVWQKVYLKEIKNNIEEYNEKYILVAELNANVPKISIETAPALTIQDGQEVWNNLDVYKKPVSATDEEFVFQIPSFNLSVENPQRYIYTEENPTDNSKKIIDMYGQEWINNPGKKIQIHKKDSNEYISPEDVLTSGDTYNYFKWNYVKDNENNIIGKQLSGEVLSIGALVSKLYDILYGSPLENNGNRLGYNTKMPDIPEYGLIGLLDSIAPTVVFRPTTDEAPESSKSYYYYDDGELKQFTGTAFEPDIIYYEKINKAYSLITQWQNADEAGTNGTYIEGIPEVIGTNIDWNENKTYCSINYEYNNEHKYLNIPKLVRDRINAKKQSFILDSDTKGILNAYQIVIK